jgi:chromosome segregation ATPase
MVTTVMEKANKGTEEKQGNTPDSTPADGNETPSSEKRYTEAEMKAKLADQQREIQRNELKPLREQIKDLQTDKTALEVQLSESQADNEALKSTVAELNGQIEEGLPEDAKEAHKKWGQSHIEYARKKAELIRDYGAKDKQYEEQNQRILQLDAKDLLAKYPNSGLSADTLVAQGNLKDMKAYLFDHLDSTGYKQPEAKAEETKPETPVENNPKPGGTNQAGGSEKSEEQIWDEMYPTMK